MARMVKVLAPGLVVAAILLLYSPAAAQRPGDSTKGRQVYLKYCSLCHGTTGKGNGPNAPFVDTQPRDHTDGQFMSSQTDQDLFNAVSQGGLAVGKSNLMPPWGMTLNQQQVWDLVAFMRTLHPKVQAPAPATEEKPKKKELF